jgi:clan AA aspartic protease (TIGR02281 family)
MRHPIPVFVILVALLAPALLSARIYIWTDAEGVKHYSQEPPPENATDVMVQDEVRYDPSADAKSHRTETEPAAGSHSTTAAQQTRIVLEGNVILLPVTLVYEEREVDTMLVLDTGASSTVLTAALAERLGIKAAINAKVKVAGGELIDAQSVTLDSLSVGPHTRQAVSTLILRHQGAPTKLQGALGLNFLKHYPYTIDMQQMVINWGVANPATAP